MVLKPGHEEDARRIFEKWELDFAIIGRLTDTRRMVLRWHGDVVASIPIPPVVTEAPVYERPWMPTPLPAALSPQDVPPPKDYAQALLKLVGSPDQCSKAWVWQQYDHLIMGNTAIRPGGDAAVVRVPGGVGLEVEARRMIAHDTTLLSTLVSRAARSRMLASRFTIVMRE